LPAFGTRDTSKFEENYVADVLALVDDLFFQAKLAETARQAGVTLQTVTNGEALANAVAAQTPRLVLVDLNARQGPLNAVQQLKASADGVPIVGFLSHVQTELAEQALAAGCSQVLPRSRLSAELPSILQRFIS
jgi:CheY-like chemotaxis protein